MHIALLEDDSAQGDLIQSVLVYAGYTCTLFTSGRDILAALSRPNTFDVLLLDWEVHDISGFEVLHWVRSNLGHAIPVMFVTSRNQEADLVSGLQAGADDYMIKPVRKAEFVARLDALTRRLAPVPVQQENFRCGVYEFYPATACARLKGRPVDLAPKEFELAVLFFRNPSRLFSRDVLSSTIWNRDIPATSRTIDTHLSNIRRKLELKPEHGVRLSASYAIGYRLDLLADSILAIN